MVGIIVLFVGVDVDMDDVLFVHPVKGKILEFWFIFEDHGTTGGIMSKAYCEHSDTKLMLVIFSVDDDIDNAL